MRTRSHTATQPCALRYVQGLPFPAPTPTPHCGFNTLTVRKTRCPATPPSHAPLRRNPQPQRGQREGVHPRIRATAIVDGYGVGVRSGVVRLVKCCVGVL